MHKYLQICRRGILEVIIIAVRKQAGYLLRHRIRTTELTIQCLLKRTKTIQLTLRMWVTSTWSSLAPPAVPKRTVSVARRRIPYSTWIATIRLRYRLNSSYTVTTCHRCRVPKSKATQGIIWSEHTVIDLHKTFTTESWIPKTKKSAAPSSRPLTLIKSIRALVLQAQEISLWFSRAWRRTSPSISRMQSIRLHINIHSRSCRWIKEICPQTRARTTHPISCMWTNQAWQITRRWAC